MANNSNAVVPPPPRATGDPATDTQAMIQWAWDFFKATVVESGLLDPSFQSDAGTFDANNLPVPADSSIAKAQDTANRAIEALKAHALFP
jgi:hypothetical protein